MNTACLYWFQWYIYFSILPWTALLKTTQSSTSPSPRQLLSVIIAWGAVVHHVTSRELNSFGRKRNPRLCHQVVVQLASSSNFICDHEMFCHPNCYDRQRRSCARLMNAICKVYQSGAEDSGQKEKVNDKKDKPKDPTSRRVSAFRLTSLGLTTIF